MMVWEGHEGGYKKDETLCMITLVQHSTYDGVVRWCRCQLGRRVDKERGTLLKRESERVMKRHYSLGEQHSFEREILREQSTMMYFKLWIICGGEDNTTFERIICSSSEIDACTCFR